MSETKEIRGAIKKDDKLYCEKCGADLSQDGSAKFVAHADVIDTYRYIYNCCKCGGCITMVYERDEEDKAYWR